MRIKRIDISNFRLLSKISVCIEDDITLIVGKNNTGKTSLFEAINIFTKSQEVSFEDFSENTYPVFCDCGILYHRYLSETDEEQKELLEIELKASIPKISLLIDFEYDKAKDSLINLSEFITDLDETRNDAAVLVSFEPKDTLGLFKSFKNREDKSIELILWLKDNLKSYYQLKCYAIDKLSDNKKEIDQNFKQKIEKVVSFEDIKASRTLDDTKADKNKTLALGFSHYYRERDKGKQDVVQLEATLKAVSQNLKVEYQNVLNDVLVDLNKFGAQTPISIPEIEIGSEFNSESVIRNNIKYYYKQGEITLPESYNGLGYSNLIFMILEITSFIARFENSIEEKKSEFLTILIEEPEAHMHPQMQQVFISQITKKINESKRKGFNIQLIITTHSSHIVAEAGIDLEKGFDRIRYFNKIDGKLEINDFHGFKHKNDKDTFRFLKQYLNLQKCDIFFADKVIMVEGVTEKMLLPIMINKVAPNLNNEYLSILEVGGAYTQKFKELLHFIKSKTLIITDIDSVDPSTKEKCKTDLIGAITQNSTLKDWIPKKEKITELAACTESEKFDGKLIRIAYQVKEKNSQNVARSLEEAIIEVNLDFFKSSYEENGETKKIKSSFSVIDQYSSEVLESQTAWELHPKSSSAKTNFAFDLMTFDEVGIGKIWEVPLYIKEGLEWLANINA